MTTNVNVNVNVKRRRRRNHNNNLCCYILTTMLMVSCCCYIQYNCCYNSIVVDSFNIQHIINSNRRRSSSSSSLILLRQQQQQQQQQQELILSSIDQINMEGTSTSNDNGNNNDKEKKDKYELPSKLKLLLQPTRRKLQERPGNNLNYSNNNASHANNTTSTNNSSVVVLPASVHQNRKPRGYWKNITNIEYELRNLWIEKMQISNNANNDDNNNGDKLLVKLLYEYPPPIPNEALLNYWNRHDIRNAIRSYGGRTLLSEDLLLLASLLMSSTSTSATAVTSTTTSNGLVAMSRSSSSSSSNSRNSSSSSIITTIIPGKWKDMIEMKHPLIIKVLQNDQNLNFIKAPSTTIIRTTATTTSKKKNNKQQLIRRDYGIWSKEKVIDVLYKYLKERKRKYNIPSIWMPRLSELEKNIFNISIISDTDTDTDTDDTNFGYLKHAIANYYGTVDNYGQAGPTSNSIGGVDQLCCDAGLVPYYEWRYIEGQHDLLISLKEYIDDKNKIKNNTDNGNGNGNGNNTSIQPSSISSSSSLPILPDYTIFPSGYSTTWRNDGYKSLFRSVQDYGGVDFVSGRFGMIKESKKNKKYERSYMYWGPFDIEFGMLLMEYVRLDQLQKVPKLSNKMYNNNNNNNNNIYKSRSNTICMPTKKELLSKSKLSPSSILLLLKRQPFLSQQQDGQQEQERQETKSSPSSSWGEYLHKKIIAYGGYENVARRLGLHWE
jgi:hypothetical protein